MMGRRVGVCPPQYVRLEMSAFLGSTTKLNVAAKPRATVARHGHAPRAALDSEPRRALLS